MDSSTLAEGLLELFPSFVNSLFKIKTDIELIHFISPSYDWFKLDSKKKRLVGHKSDDSGEAELIGINDQAIEQLEYLNKFVEDYRGSFKDKDYNECIPIHLTFFNVSHYPGNNQQYCFTKESYLLINDFYTPKITSAISKIPNRRMVYHFQTLIGDRYYQDTSNDRVIGNVFHKICEDIIQGKLKL